MDNFHFSTAECFENCPARFGFRYRQNIEVLPTDDPANPLILGTAIHRGIEKDIDHCAHVIARPAEGAAKVVGLKLSDDKE